MAKLALPDTMQMLNLSITRATGDLAQMLLLASLTHLDVDDTQVSAPSDCPGADDGDFEYDGKEAVDTLRTWMAGRNAA